MKDFGRVLTAMVTPFDAQMQIDYRAAADLARYLADNGTQGIVVAGTTGESPTLTKEEKIKLFVTVKEAVGDRVAVIAGTGSNNTATSVELTREAEKIGVDGVMLVVPYYNKPSQDGLYNHFKMVAEATSLPIMLYNIPGRTGINLLPTTVVQLAKTSNIVAIKEAGGSLDQAGLLLSTLPDGFRVYSGDDNLTLPMLAIGAYGVVSVAAHIIGPKMQAMIKAYLDGQVQEAARLHLELMPVFKVLFITSNPVPVKYALNARGINVGGVRPPLAPPTADEEASLKKILNL